MSHAHRGKDHPRFADLYRAASDFFLLQNNGYPRNSALQWVGNRHGLTALQRDFINRGVFSQERALRRRAKRCSGSSWQGKMLMVDGHNVQITVESTLSGSFLLIGNDGALRDLAGRSAQFRFSEISAMAMDMIFYLFEELRPSRVTFLFDAPLSRSGQMADEYRRRMRRLGLAGDARAVPVPEREFDYQGSVLASSDGAVLDSSSEWLDLARWVIDAQISWQPAADFSRLIFSRSPQARELRPTFMDGADT